MVAGLSGRNYVAAKLKVREEGDRDKWLQVRIASTKLCDHVATVCATKTCFESWQLSYNFSLERTDGGRKLAKLVK